MKQNKKTVPAELSYYGLYLLDYLRKYHPTKFPIRTLLQNGRKPPPPPLKRKGGREIQ